MVRACNRDYIGSYLRRVAGIMRIGFKNWGFEFEKGSGLLET